MRGDFSEYSARSKLLLPHELATEMAKKEFDEWERQEAEAAKTATRLARKKPVERDAHGAARKRASWDADIALWPGPNIKMFDTAEVQETADLIELTAYDDYSRDRARAMIHRFFERGEKSKLKTIPVDAQENLEAFASRMPNFREVVQYLLEELAIAARGDQVIAPCPIVLSGPPGVGKSLFATRFAEWHGAGGFDLRMENAQTATALTGAETYWSNAAPGRLFMECMSNQWANFTVFIDEIDKCSASANHDPISALYALLEPASAREFYDLCYPKIRLNCSRTIWICTCNSIETLPAPILSRVKVFQIPSPSEEESIAIAEAIMRETQCMALTSDSRRWLRVADDAVVALSRLSPREMQRASRQSIGRALLAGRDIILREDVPIMEARNSRIGFY